MSDISPPPGASAGREEPRRICVTCGRPESEHPVTRREPGLSITCNGHYSRYSTDMQLEHARISIVRLEAECESLRSALAAERAAGERYRALRENLTVVSTGPRGGYYLTGDILPNHVRLSAGHGVDAFADALIAARALAADRETEE